MPTVSSQASSKRAASISRITGKAVCCDCGGEIFDVVIYNDTTHDIVCLNSACRAIWSSFGEGYGPIAHICKAVAPRRNEPSNVVQTKEEEES